MNAIKRLVKTIIPRNLLQSAKSGVKALSKVDSPRSIQFEGLNGSVLNCCIAYNEHGGYCIPLAARHRPAAQVVMKGKVYEPDTIAFISKNCVGGDIIHAGTFFGDFIPSLSRACGEGLKVWAFEPNPESFRCAKITCTINNLENVELFNVALGEGAYPAMMLVRDEQGVELGGSSRLGSDEKAATAAGTVEVQVQSVDLLVPVDRKISIIHLDVEAYEEQALAGAMKTIERHRPLIIVENLPSEEWISQNLAPLQYEVAETLHHNRILRSKSK